MSLRTLLALIAVALAAPAALATASRPALPHAAPADVVQVKMGLDTLSKADKATFWQRVDAYASIDAVHQFCGKNLNLVRRTWMVVSPCIETTSLHRVRSVFLSKRANYRKGWDTAYADAEKKKVVCTTLKPRLDEWTKLLNAHLAEAKAMCSACFFC